MSENTSAENDSVPGDPTEENVTAEEVVADAETAVQEGVATVPAAEDDIAPTTTLEPAAAPIVVPAAEDAAEEAPAESVVDAARTAEEPATDEAEVHEPIALPAAAPVTASDDAAADAAPAEEAAIADAPAEDEIGAPVAEPESTDADRAAAAAAIAAMNDDDDTPWYDRADVAEATAILPESVQSGAAPAADLAADARTTVVDAPAEDLAAAPVVDAPTVVAPAVIPPVAPSLIAPEPAQPIFVQAPEPPRKRGNRGFSGVVGLIATLIFAVVYMAATLFASDATVFTDAAKLGEAALEQVSSFAFWTPVVAFFLGFWLLGAFINTAKWAYWVIFGLIVGLIALAGHAAGVILQANPFTVTPTEALELATTSIFSLPGLVALVLGRELPVWLGGWIARRGRRVVAANAEAQDEYQRTLDAGPQLAP